MNDHMTEQDIAKEMDFWNNYIQIDRNFKHKNFYVNFFDFSSIKGNCLEIGCGGSPFITYADNVSSDLKLSLLDPLIDEISKNPRYNFLNNYTRYNCTLRDCTTQEKYDFIVCLNVLDHFGSSHEKFIDTIKSLLSVNGILFLYYDIREKYSDWHYSINHTELYKHIKSSFVIIKESLDINPEHRNWSTVYGSFRGILKNK
jgi:2-polyprenyl-3-methyl-5-hydroxy-6-metoxy-1,4-benzoquinol methylase